MPQDILTLSVIYQYSSIPPHQTFPMKGKKNNDKVMHKIGLICKYDWFLFFSTLFI